LANVGRRPCIGALLLENKFWSRVAWFKRLNVAALMQIVRAAVVSLARNPICEG
jgi:hypothetical protein